jgi:hypothetical protein
VLNAIQRASEIRTKLNPSLGLAMQRLLMNFLQAVLGNGTGKNNGVDSGDNRSWARWHITIIPAIQEAEQEDLQFKTSLGS